MPALSINLVTVRMGVYRAQLVSWFMSTAAIDFRFNMIQRTNRQLSLRINPCLLLPGTSPTSTYAQADSHHRSHHTSQSPHTFPRLTAGLQLLEMSASAVQCLRLCGLGGMLLATRLSLLLATTSADRPSDRPLDHRPSTIAHFTMTSHGVAASVIVMTATFDAAAGTCSSIASLLAWQAAR